MNRFVLKIIFIILLATNVQAKTLEQKKDEIKNIYQDGGISKVEYEKSLEFLEKSDDQEKKIKKQSFSLKNKKQIKNIFKKKDEDLEKITLEKIDALGKPVKFDDSYFTKGMIKKFRGCNNNLKCKGKKAGANLFKTFNRSKSYGQKNPGEMIKAMAMYEVFYGSKLWYAKKSLERYKENNYKRGFFQKRKKMRKKFDPYLV